MKAKFKSDSAFQECARYAQPQAIGALIIGLIIGIGAVAGGITVMTFQSIPGGVLLMASLLLLSFMLCYYGLVGASKMLKSNTILMATEFKKIEIADDMIIEEVVADGAKEIREIGYQHVSGVVLRKGIFVFYISDGTSIICDVLKITEGDVDELRTFLDAKFGKLYHEKADWDKNLFAKEDESTELDLKENAVNGDEFSESEDEKTQN